MDKRSVIMVAGGAGMVGSAIARKLRSDGFANILAPSHQELDLTRQEATERYLIEHQPNFVFLAAAKVGGIWANSHYPGDFIYSNLCIQVNVMESARRIGVEKLLFIGSSCIYPREAPQPIKEEHLLTSRLEETNEAYAIAKIAGIKMCTAYNRQYGTNYVSCMPTNLYGPGDNYTKLDSHVIPGLIRRFHEAKQANEPQVTVWGTGSPLREFMHVDDFARAAVLLMENYDGDEHLNVGSGQEVTIKALAGLVKEAVGYPGEIVWDASKPDGTPRKLLDSSKIMAMGFRPIFSLREGLANTYRDFLTGPTRL